MDASIIVCTYNRADSLKDTLHALARQQVAANRKWEIIVVDNNSKDDTRTVVEELQAKLPLLRYEFEPKQGLSHARNHGIDRAHGEILLFTDDDVLPEPDWLENVLTGLDHYQADACGGYIAPIFETPPPQWLNERFHGFLAVRAERSDDYWISEGMPPPFGANMAFKKAVFDHLGGFDIARGRKGKNLASGEDGEMFERLLKAGMKVIFLGNARVHHKVESFRLSKNYFRRWRYQSSRNIAQTIGFPGQRRLRGVPLYLFGQLGRALIKATKAKFTAPADEAFQQEIIVWHFLGTIAGLWHD